MCQAANTCQSFASIAANTSSSAIVSYGDVFDFWCTWTIETDTKSEIYNCDCSSALSYFHGSVTYTGRHLEGAHCQLKSRTKLAIDP